MNNPHAGAQFITPKPKTANALFLEVIGLKKSYGLKPILRGIDLTLCRGQRMALLGANGAGKTTLLRILSGLTKPSAGSVCIDGRDVVRDAQGIRQLVGFVAHQPYLYDELTALENLHFFGKMYSVRDSQQRIHELLYKVGLAKRARERVSTLSRGQVQRLSLARALLHSPQLLLLDEPDTGLDQEGHTLIETLIAEHTNQRGSVLFTTHQLERALELSDSVIVLNGGRVVLQQKTDNVDVATLRQATNDLS